jgi:hypothetical protein
MATQLVLTDPTAETVTPARWYERWALDLINDPRDLPFIRLSLAAAMVLLPAAIYLYWPGNFRWWLGLGYFLLNFFVFFDRYILMLHNTSHRPLFKRQHWRLNRLIPWVLGPMFGQTPDTYYVHHMGMHHPENNLEDDLSSTMHYRRDSFLHWLVYFLRFFFLIHIEIGRYLKSRGRLKLRRRMYLGELSWWALVVGLMFLNWQATLFVFVAPFLAARVLMMVGNWGQHAFIDASRPGNCYVNSITCINGRYNRRCFNDGYHIGHHIKASRHWTEMPGDLLHTRDEYVRNGAIVFEGIDFFMVWLYLMLKRYDWLARRYVQLGEREMSEEEIVTLLRERTQPIERSASSLEPATNKA